MSEKKRRDILFVTDSIFSDMIEERRVIVYMDDILIFAEKPTRTPRTNETGTPTITGTQPFPETKEMQVQ
jgi:hypothetical protein